MKRILISRTDSIGDVALTLPMCQALRNKYPEAEIISLVKITHVRLSNVFMQLMIFGTSMNS